MLLVRLKMFFKLREGWGIDPMGTINEQPFMIWLGICGLLGPEWKFVLTCTHKQLVWGGCALQQRAVKTCSLKNQSSHREKLLLKVTDSNRCFKVTYINMCDGIVRC